MKGHGSFVRRLVESGSDVNAESQMGTPLQVACKNGHSESARFLLERGAQVNPTNAHLSPLSIAIDSSPFDLAEELLDRGANIFASDKEKGSALHYACLRANT